MAKVPRLQDRGRASESGLVKSRRSRCPWPGAHQAGCRRQEADRGALRRGAAGVREGHNGPSDRFREPRVLGPLPAQRWEFKDPACPWPFTAELWKRGDGKRLMEGLDQGTCRADRRARWAASWPCWRRWAPSATRTRSPRPEWRSTTTSPGSRAPRLAGPPAARRRPRSESRKAGCTGETGGFPLPKETVNAECVESSCRSAFESHRSPPWTSSSALPRWIPPPPDTGQDLGHRRRSPINQRDLALAYSPGSAAACDAIAARSERGAFAHLPQQPGGRHHERQRRSWGLGNIGPLAGKPVMEGKACLFKKFQRDQRVRHRDRRDDPEELVKTFARLERPSAASISRTSRRPSASTSRGSCANA